MRNLLIIISVLLLNGINLYSQWSTEPNNNLVIGYGLNPELCSDSAGGCYITYEVGYPSKLYLHRVDKYGYQPWGDKRIIAGELDEQSNAKIIEDGEGGVIVSYGDRIMFDSYRLRVQKVDSNGNFLWGPTGFRVSIVDTIQGSQRIVTDGNGGCVIVWIESDTSQYRINRIDRNGQRVWSDSGLYIQSDYNSTPPRLIRASDGNYYVQIRYNLYRISKNGDIVLQDSNTLTNIVPDSEGGVVQSGMTGNINNRKLVAQRQDSLGNKLWQEPYIEIDDSLYYPDPKLMVLKNDNYFYFTWMGNKYGVTRVAQFQSLRLDGSKLFPEGSISISNRTPLSVAGIIPSESTKTIFVWNDDPNLADTTLAQNYDTLGNKIWDENGIVIAHPAFSDIGYTIDQNGGFIIGGTINDFTIVAQQVSKNGNLGEIIPVPVELISFSGFVDKDKIIINWITATELNNYGFDIERKATLNPSKGETFENWESIGFVSGYGTTTETQSYSFTDENVTKGIYKYRLKQIDFDGSFTYSNEIEVEVDYNPKEFVLYQNYPNPFNPVTTIKYDIVKAQDVKVTVFDILGIEIATLVNEQQQPGSYQVKWDASNVSSGIYFYQLRTKDFVGTKKMIILK